MIESKEMENVEEKMPIINEHELFQTLNNGVFAVVADHSKWNLIEGYFHKKFLIIIDTPVNNFWCLTAVKQMKKLITAMQLKRKRLELSDVGFINIHLINNKSIEEIVSKSDADFILLFANNWCFSEIEIAVYQNQMVNNKPLLRVPSYESITQSDENRTTAWIAIKRFLDMK